MHPRHPVTAFGPRPSRRTARSRIGRSIEHALAPLLTQLVILGAVLIVAASTLQMAGRPQTVVRSRATGSRPRGNATRTGRVFITGLAERGPVGVPIAIHNLDEFEKVFGTRQSYSLLWDWMDVHFHDGGHTVFVSRVVGPAPVTATSTLVDRGAPLSTLRIDAYGPGLWGNSLSRQVINGVAANTFVIIILRNGVEVERTPELANPQAAAEWSTSSPYVRITNLGSATAAPNNNPAVVAAAALAGGTDDQANILEAQWTAALPVFPDTLGPGQVVACGRTTQTAHQDLENHATANNRTAVLDGPDSGVVATVTAAADGARAGAGDDAYAGFWGGAWVLYPGIVTGTTRTVPPSALVCARIAASDARTGDANVSVAFDQGVGIGRSSIALGVTRTFTNAEWDTLSDKGVNLITVGPEGVEVSGFDSLEIGGDWGRLAHHRFRMQLVDEATQIARKYLERRLNPQTFSDLGGHLSGWLAGYYKAGALVGATAADAYSVDVGETVNTEVTIGAGEIHANFEGQFAEHGRKVIFDLIRNLGGGA